MEFVKRCLAMTTNRRLLSARPAVRRQQHDTSQKAYKNTNALISTSTYAKATKKSRRSSTTSRL